jgi:hypothetical protein
MIGNIFGALSLPVVLAVLFFLVQVMEASFGSGTGAEKKAKTIEAIVKLFEMMKWNLPPFIKDNLGIFIDWACWIFNSLIGFFSHGSTTK